MTGRVTGIPTANANNSLVVAQRLVEAVNRLLGANGVEERALRAQDLVTLGLLSYDKQGADTLLARGDFFTTLATTILASAPGILPGRHNFNPGVGVTPTPADNYSLGYGSGSFWCDTTITNGTLYICVYPGDAGDPYAVWRPAGVFGLSYPLRDSSGQFYDNAGCVGVNSEVSVWGGNQTSYGSTALSGSYALVDRCFTTIEAGGSPLGDPNNYGQAQKESTILVRGTTDATPSVIRADASSSHGNLLVNSATTVWVEMRVLAREPATGDSKVWTIEFACQRIGTASLATIDSVTKTVKADSAGAAAWDVSVGYNTNVFGGGEKSIELSVTGEAAKTISWTAFVTMYVNSAGVPPI